MCQAPIWAVGIVALVACGPKPTVPVVPSGVEVPASATGTDAEEGGVTFAEPVTSTELNLYAWSEYVPQSVLDAFEVEYGVSVNYDTYASNEELLARLQAGASGYDVILPSDYMVAQMAAQGLLEPIDVTRLPSFHNVETRFHDPPFDPGNRHSVPYQWGTVGIAVDTRAVTQTVTHFADLWDPAFRDRLVVLDDEREMLGIALAVLGHDRNSTDPAEIAAARDKLIELKPNIRLFDSDSPKTTLLAGDVAAGIVWNGEAALAARENADIAYVLPSDGCGLWFDNLAIPAGAPHPDAALAFLDFVLRPESGLAITREFPYSSPNGAALDLLAEEDPDAYAAYVASPATHPPDEALAACDTVEDVGAALPLWSEAWTAVKSAE